MIDGAHCIDKNLCGSSAFKQLQLFKIQHLAALFVSQVTL